jgi:excisionase family DNA binding protein
MENHAIHSDAKAVYTVQEVSQILGVSRPAVYELLRGSKIRSVKIGTHYRIPARALAEFLDGKAAA